MKHIVHVVGARPNFMKLAPVHRALMGRARQTIVHTGQHYDPQMSDVFFSDLGIPEPTVNLQVGSGSHAEQTAHVMLGLEPHFQIERPDVVLVYGDVNSTVAAALVCSKLLVPLGHIEAGLRSGDRTMPEEVNRIVTDAVADLLFTPSEDAGANLASEGVPPQKVHFVGNVMIDTLVHLLPRTNPAHVRRKLGVGDQPYTLVTLHRPATVDRNETLLSVLQTLQSIPEAGQFVFPIHPRTRLRLQSVDHAVNGRLKLIDPLGYLDFLALEREASLVITDSGGVQEETTYLGVPCITVRTTTERPVTVSTGTNVVVGHDMERLRAEMARVYAGDAKKGSIPPLWDGRASVRIANIVMRRLSS